LLLPRERGLEAALLLERENPKGFFFFNSSSSSSSSSSTSSISESSSNSLNPASKSSSSSDFENRFLKFGHRMSAVTRCAPPAGPAGMKSEIIAPPHMIAHSLRSLLFRLKVETFFHPMENDRRKNKAFAQSMESKQTMAVSFFRVLYNWVWCKVRAVWYLYIKKNEFFFFLFRGMGWVNSEMGYGVTVLPLSVVAGEFSSFLWFWKGKR